jgi:hypothetical protein
LLRSAWGGDAGSRANLQRGLQARAPGPGSARGRSSSAHSGERRISSLTVEARPTHALAHQAPCDAPIGGHAVIGDMDPDCIALIALWIEGAACPMRGAASPDFQNKPIADLFMLHAGLDPGVDAANRLAARLHPDVVLPSPRAQSPRYDGPLADAALPGSIISIAAMSPGTLRIIQSLRTSEGPGVIDRVTSGCTWR